MSDVGPERVEKRLVRAMSRAVVEFAMLADRDRVLVAVSGGKDSYTMLHLLRALQRKAPVKFELCVMNVHQGHPGYPADVLRAYMAKEGYDFTMVEEDTYSIVTQKIPAGKTFCSLCSRLRRGIIYRVAKELGCNKVALGHHRDDVLQTLFLNLFFAGRLATMPPVLLADRGRLTVIRPLVFCAEDDIRDFARFAEFPILPCDLCGAQEHLQRKAVGSLLDQLERDRPGTKRSILSALQNASPTHLLDRRLWEALGIRAASEVTGEEEEEGDVARPYVLDAARLVRG